jgi:hypothetical protein
MNEKKCASRWLWRIYITMHGSENVKYDNSSSLPDPFVQLCVQSMLVELSTFCSYSLFHKRSALDLSSVYMNWFCSFLANRKSAARIYWIVSFSFGVLSGFHGDFALGSLFHLSGFPKLAGVKRTPNKPYWNGFLLDTWQGQQDNYTTRIP